MTILSKWEGERQSNVDLERKFLHTYCLISLDGAPAKVYKIIQIHDVVMLYEGDGNQRVIHEVDINKVDMILPNVPAGIYTLGDKSIALVRRVPSRQWFDGLCVHNTVVLKNAEEPITPFNAELANTLFTPQVDLSVQDALKGIKRNQRLRLTSRYWVSKERNIVNLYRLRARLGSWCFGKFFWAPKGRLFQQEVQDELGIHA